MKITDWDQKAGQASELLKALSSPHRLKLLCAMVSGEQSVGALAEQLGVRETLVSQHLTLLRKDRLVEARRDGRTIYYRIASKQAEAVIATLYRLYCEEPGFEGGDQHVETSKN